jgi:lipopolysaccharide biosynthesis regulator YciM
MYSHKAQELLLDIYQQDKNWKDAIDTAQKLATSDYSYHTEVAQFNCELAQESMIKSDNQTAQTHTKQALEINRKCVRANLLLGDIYFSQEKYQEAISTWQLIEKQNYLYLPMVANRMFDAYLHLDKVKECLTLIKGYTALYPNLNLSDFLYQKLLQFETPTTVLEYLRLSMKHYPNAKVAALIVDLHLNNRPPALLSEAKPDAEMIKNLLLKYNDKLSNHRCGRCNFKAKTFFWQCPACYEWESINPNNNEN